MLTITKQILFTVKNSNKIDVNTIMSPCNSKSNVVTFFDSSNKFS